MELTEQKVRRLKKSTAESFTSLSLGLWTVSIIGYFTSGISFFTYFLVAVGGLSAVFSIYLILPWNWKQEPVLKYLETNQIIKIAKFLVWLIVLTTFALGLIQTKVGWLIVIGLIIAIIAFIVFYVGMWRTKGGKKWEVRVERM